MKTIESAISEQAIAEQYVERKRGVASLPEYTSKDDSAQQGIDGILDQHVEFWKADLDNDRFQFESRVAGAADYRKRFAESAKRLTAYMMSQAVRHATKAEAQLAATDLPAFVRTVVMTVKRIYPALVTPQLFPVIPMSQPLMRYWFEDDYYDDAFVGSAPNVAADQRIDLNVSTTLNPDFLQVDELGAARRIKYRMSFLDFAEKSYRLIGDISDQFKDDARSVYGQDAESKLYDKFARLFGLGIDVKMLARVLANIPAANDKTWVAQPGANPNYSTLVPTEKKAYDETLWNAIQDTINAINVTNILNPEGAVDWCICGSNAALALGKLTSFKPILSGATTVTGLAKGALRDIGAIDTLGIRVLTTTLIDPATFVFGSTAGVGEPAIAFAPHVPYEVLRDNYNTDRGLQTIGVRSRFGIVEPNLASNAASARLAHRYGRLVIT
jgi:hypothetical protein